MTLNYSVKLKTLVFFISLFYSFTANAIVLEALEKDGKLSEVFENHKICFYPGSFDPLHNGHVEVANYVLDQNWCDYTLVYPSWGGDNYKKRQDINIRLDMLFSVFESHPKILVTRLNPISLQKTLTASGGDKVISKFPGTEYIGVIGSDVALALDDNIDALSKFMSGTKIPKRYEDATIGGLMALPAKTFIVSIREGDNIDAVGEELGDRKIIQSFKTTNFADLSSSQVKKIIFENGDVSNLVPAKVLEIINSKWLYR
ncbi:MAG: hypothetical protein J0G32_03700 [Alphaproteobacteria bacterium]|nr:hypothetical protein [Alphaproteobacteria bacterium]OJV16046.1 MAG: hypothetical protein BGO27_04285 [Alphaproteobacteria bacterium 33-17]